MSTQNFMNRKDGSKQAHHTTHHPLSVISRLQHLVKST